MQPTYSPEEIQRISEEETNGPVNRYEGSEEGGLKPWVQRSGQRFHLKAVVSFRRDARQVAALLRDRGYKARVVSVAAGLAVYYRSQDKPAVGDAAVSPVRRQGTGVASRRALLEGLGSVDQMRRSRN